MQTFIRSILSCMQTNSLEQSEMNISCASLFAYLLFPLITERQADYAAEIRAAGSEPFLDAQKKNELLHFLGMDGTAAAYAPLPEPLRPDMPAAEVYMRNSLGRLKLFEYEEEQLSLSENSDGSFSCVSVNNDVVSRITYDSLCRAVEKTVWKNADSVSDSVMLLEKKWSYSGSVIFSTEKQFQEKKLYEVQYNSSRKPVSIYEYDLPPDPADEKIPVSKSAMSYDDKGRLSCEEQLFFAGRQDGTEPVFRRKTVFSYSGLSSAADIKVYENGMLRLSTEHTGENSYIERIYFDGGFYVQSLFQDGVKTEEQIVSGKEEEPL